MLLLMRKMLPRAESVSRERLSSSEGILQVFTLESKWMLRGIQFAVKHQLFNCNQATLFKSGLGQNPLGRNPLGQNHFWTKSHRTKCPRIKSPRIKSPKIKTK